MEKADCGKNTFHCIHMGGIYESITYIKTNCNRIIYVNKLEEKNPFLIVNKFNKLNVNVWEECK